MKEYDNYPTGVVKEIVGLLEKGVPKNRVAVLGGVNGLPYKVVETQNSSHETLATNDNIVGWGDEKQTRGIERK